jgi:hypothetical protein
VLLVDYCEKKPMKSSKNEITRELEFLADRIGCITWNYSIIITPAGQQFLRPLGTIPRPLQAIELEVEEEWMESRTILR